MTEIRIVEIINHLGLNSFLDKITSFLSNNFALASLLLLVLILVYFLDQKKGKFVLISIIIALFLHLLITELFFKHLLPQFGLFRVRPFLAYPDQITLIGKYISDSSFPSSHVSSLTAVMTVITFYYRKIFWAAIVVVVMMGLIRLHNGVHYPSDVLAGIILGIFYGWSGIIITRKIVAKK